MSIKFTKVDRLPTDAETGDVFKVGYQLWLRTPLSWAQVDDTPTGLALIAEMRRFQARCVEASKPKTKRTRWQRFIDSF